MENFKSLADLLQNTVSQQPLPSGLPHAFSDTDLKGLREQIKRIIIPKLIRVFELKLAAQQAAAPPSRITGQRPDATKLFEIKKELDQLSSDLALLHLWCESCQKQIDRALDEVKQNIEKYDGHSS
jgi:hypothetical protein